MPVDLQPTLKREILWLRPLRPEDFDRLDAVASDPLIWQQHLFSGWQQREAALKQAAANTATKETAAQFEEQIAALTLKKDAETGKRVGELQVKGLEDQVARRAAQVAALEKQLAEAKQQVQDK